MDEYHFFAWDLDKNRPIFKVEKLLFDPSKYNLILEPDFSNLEKYENPLTLLISRDLKHVKPSYYVTVQL